jgi:hypothetical protein
MRARTSKMLSFSVASDLADGGSKLWREAAERRWRAAARERESVCVVVRCSEKDRM